MKPITISRSAPERQELSGHIDTLPVAKEQIQEILKEGARQLLSGQRPKVSGDLGLGFRLATRGGAECAQG